MGKPPVAENVGKVSASESIAASGAAFRVVIDGVVIAEVFVAAADAAFDGCAVPGADCETVAIGIVVAV